MASDQSTMSYVLIRWACLLTRQKTTNEVLQTSFFTLGFIVLLYCLWLIITDPLSKSAKPLSTSGNQTESFAFVILDYSAYIEDNNGDYVIGNCLITQNPKFADQAEAVVITHRKLRRITDLPKIRYPWQRWVWLLDESPHHPTVDQSITMADFNNFYNWTMTYRTNSDVYVPYGRTQKTREPVKTVPYLGKREGLVAAVISNCDTKYVHNSRMEYIKLLQINVPVSLYGRCNGKTCPGHETILMHSVCPEISNYLFYLAFENSNCKEYITEKFFANGFESGAVPVVLGASKHDYKKVAPPNSFIHVRDFRSPEKLGEYLKYLASNRTAYIEYHMWRKEYTTSKRLQYLSRSIWEPLCAKLNNDNQAEKIIPDLSTIWTLSDCNDTVFW